MLHVLSTLGRMRRLVTHGLEDGRVGEIRRPGGTIAAHDYGAGPAVLAVHAPGTFGLEWRHLVGRLRAAHQRVIVPDLRGHGASSPFATYAAEAVAADLLAVLDDAGADAATVLVSGPSAAAVDALVHLAPGRVRRVVWLAPAAWPAPTGPRAWRWLLPHTFARRALEGLARPPADAVDYARAVRRASRGRGDAALAAAAWAGRLSDRVPVRVIAGALDPLHVDPEAEARTLAARCGGAAVIIDDAGRQPHAEAPDAVAAAIVRFIRESLSGLPGGEPPRGRLG